MGIEYVVYTRFNVAAAEQPRKGLDAWLVLIGREAASMWPRLNSRGKTATPEQRARVDEMLQYGRG